MNHSKQFLTAARIYCRQMSQGQVTEVPSPRFAKLKETQKKFQIDDGVPVYLKGGFGDKALYATTVLLTLTGVGMSLETFYRLVFKK